MTIQFLRSLVRGWRTHIHAVLAPLAQRVAPTRRVIHRFRKAGAVTPYLAQRLYAASRFENQTFLRLLRLGVIREPELGCYYLDEESLKAVRSRWLPLW